MSLLNEPAFLFFDLGKVLINFDHDLVVQQLADLTDRSAEQVRNLVFCTDLQAAYERGSISTAQFCERIRNELEVSVSDAEICDAASRIFWVNASIVPLISSLCSAGYPMGILSNTCDAHWSFIRRQGYQLIELFQPWVLSFEVGASKPDGAIFEHAAQQVGLTPNQLFFVDDLPMNVQGAIDAGVDAVLFTSVGQLAKDLRDRGLRFN